MKQGSPYAFRSNRVKEILELKTMKTGMKSPFKAKGGARINMNTGKVRQQSTNTTMEDDGCFITQANSIFPNMMLRTRDGVAPVYSKRSRTQDGNKSQGNLGLEDPYYDLLYNRQGHSFDRAVHQHPAKSGSSSKSKKGPVLTRYTYEVLRM